MTDKRLIYQHFHSDEKVFIDKISDLITKMENTYTYQLTEFLDPRQLQIALSVLGHAQVKHFVSTLMAPMEYARVIIAPDYYELSVEDFNLTLVEIDYPRKFYTLSHRQVLGALLNQLGIRRSLLGDILLVDKRVQIFLDQDKVIYLRNQVEKIASVPVSFREVSLEERLVGEGASDEQLVLTISFRADTLLAKVIKESRTTITRLIEQEKVKCNYHLLQRGSQDLKLGDLISIRGYGRFQIKEILGQTKQGKYKVIIRQMIAK
ncbi:RNA-binding protein [Streptococcus sp. sy018]|uniref:YlmH family RNA-binding protein n=1 Tax=Streptococcus sp. sy018 TaxID=2600147 RepID=UPI0011B605E0|nr:YlmH/Sll1252 family protein [Streptococcus sp. sy018]TWS95437.1 RNA-binding protein [Streptococcus sp. sy018]